MTPRPDLINETEIRGFCSWWHDYSAAAVEAKRAVGKLGPDEPGAIYCMLLMNRPDGSKQSFSLRYEIGECKRMADDAVYWSERCYNFYVRPSLFRNDLEQGVSPTEKDVTQVLALVADFDGEGTLPLGLTPSFNVHTSGKNRQHWFLINAAYLAAYPLGVSLRLVTGMDSKTGCVSQPFRLPGTINYPTAEKVRRENRVAEPTYSAAWTQLRYPVEQLRSLLPNCDASPPSLAPPCLSDASMLSIDELDAKFRAHNLKGARWLAEPTGRFFLKNDEHGIPIEGTGHKSLQFWSGVRQGFRAGISPADMHRLVLARYRDGCAIKYFREAPTAQRAEAAIGRIIVSAARDFPTGPTLPRQDFSGLTVKGAQLGATERQGGAISHEPGT